MDLYLIVLRIVHVASGVFWVGAAYTFFAFIEPTAKELGPQAGKFMEGVTRRRRFPIFITSASGLAVLSGVLLYWRDSGGFRLEWITSPTGLGFTVGGLAATVAFLIGILVIKPNVDRLGEIGGALIAAGRPPTPEEGAELGRIDATMKTAGQFDMVLLTVALLAMAVSRYLGG